MPSNGTYTPPEWIAKEGEKLNKLLHRNKIGMTLYLKMWRKLRNHKHINFVKLGLA